MRKRIVVIDNKPGEVRSLKEYLELDGYEVEGLLVEGDTAEALEPARRLLNQRWFHLAVIDLHLLKDAEPDSSGLSLVTETDRAIPKIIVTAWPEWRLERLALKKDLQGTAPAIDFVSKEDPKELSKVVREAFERRVGINFDLSVEFGGITFVGMASLIKGSPHGDAELLDWAPELGDLFGKLFYGCREISIFPLYRGHRGTVIIHVLRAQAGGELTPVIVKCGPRDVIRREAENYDQFVRDYAGPWSTQKDQYQETLHFGGIVYAIAGTSLEQIKRFTDFYRGAEAGEVCRVVEQLFQETCKGWYDQRVQVSPERLDLAYLKQLSLDDPEKQTGLDRWMHVLSTSAGSLGLRGIQSVGKDIVFQFSSTSVSRYPDPRPYAFGGNGIFPAGVPFGLTHGDLNGNNILVDQRRKICWLIDFERTGWGPVLRDYAELEAVIRWELVNCKKMEELYEFEKVLSSPGSFASEMALREGEFADDLYKAVQVIARIRRLASGVVGADMRQYYMGLLFYSIRMVASGGITSPGQVRPSLVRKAHALLSATLLCYRLEHWTQWQGWTDERTLLHAG